MILIIIQSTLVSHVFTSGYVIRIHVSMLFLSSSAVGGGEPDSIILFFRRKMKKKIQHFSEKRADKLFKISYSAISEFCASFLAHFAGDTKWLCPRKKSCRDSSDGGLNSDKKAVKSIVSVSYWSAKISTKEAQRHRICHLE